MFDDPARYPFAATLEASWEIIRDELLGLDPGRFMAWPERNLYGQGWDVFGFFVGGMPLTANCERCPLTARLLAEVPGMTMAGFSSLAPGTHIRPHVGYTSEVLRYHLGLVVPEGSALRVGAETRAWKAGESLVFDDTQEHEAWNRSDRSRIILLVDFMR